MQIFISQGGWSIDSTCPYPVSGARPFPQKMSGMCRLDIWICCACRGAVEEEKMGHSSLWAPQRIALLISYAQYLGPKLLATPLCALTKTPRLKHLGNHNSHSTVASEVLSLSSWSDWYMTTNQRNSRGYVEASLASLANIWHVVLSLTSPSSAPWPPPPF